MVSLAPQGGGHMRKKEVSRKGEEVVLWRTYIWVKTVAPLPTASYPKRLDSILWTHTHKHTPTNVNIVIFRPPQKNPKLNIVEASAQTHCNTPKPSLVIGPAAPSSKLLASGWPCRWEQRREVLKSWSPSQMTLKAPMNILLTPQSRCEEKPWTLSQSNSREECDSRKESDKTTEVCRSVCLSAW